MILWLEDPFPQESEGVEDPCPQESDDPAQLSRVFIPSAVSLFSLQYLRWGSAGRRGVAGAKAFGTADHAAVRRPYGYPRTWKKNGEAGKPKADDLKYMREAMT